MKESFNDLLRKLEAGAADVRNTGDELTRRIKAFEAWLGRLPGRVPASCRLCYLDPDSDVERLLVLDKEGKSWCLYVVDYDSRLESCSGRTLLRDASVDTKTHAMRVFPDLLRAIADAQRSLVQNAKKSIFDFEAFAGQIGLKEDA